MNFLPHLASRVIGTPLLVERSRLETILAVIGPRIGVEGTGFVPSIPHTHGDGHLIKTPSGIAIVPIHGTLVKRTGAVEAASGLTSYATIEDMILEAAIDPAIRAIMLDIDSPGGEVGGVFDLAAMIFEARQTKPVWAIADDAFSAGYLLASAAERIYLPQTAGAGSVGVVAVHVDETERDAKEGRKYTTVYAGAMKNDFSRHEPLSPEAQGRLQAEVERLYGLFISAVATHRGMTESAVRATEAALFFGADAVTAGLADRVGTIRNALADLSASIQGTTKTKKKELLMDQPVPAAESTATNSPPETSTPPAQMAIPKQAAVPAVPVDGRVEFQQSAQAIVDLCSLASMPQLAGGFIASGKSPDEVRKELMSLQGDTPEIMSHVLPGDGTRVTATNLDANPVVSACRKLASTHIEGR